MFIPLINNIFLIIVTFCDKVESSLVYSVIQFICHALWFSALPFLFSLWDFTCKAARSVSRVPEYNAVATFLLCHLQRLCGWLAWNIVALCLKEAGSSCSPIKEYNRMYVLPFSVSKLGGVTQLSLLDLSVDSQWVC